MVKIKLCGFNNEDIVNYSANLGVNFLGFVFYSKSPRNISFARAKGP